MAPRQIPNSEPLSDAAFRAELEALIPQVRAFARFLYRGDRAKAEDLAQEALLRGWQARSAFAAGTRMRAWLFVLVRNLYYSERRKSWRIAPFDPETAERNLRTEAGQDAPLELDDVRRAMATLPAEQREALILIAAGGLSYCETAALLGCAIGTIKSRVNRARKALSMAMADLRLPPRDARAAEALPRIVAAAQLTAQR